jgi:oxygen-independent coproporphyrinogen III oxidase
MLLVEIEVRKLKNQLDTVYFGGGTPSLLKPSQIGRILTKLNTDKATEITLEAHPNTLTKQIVSEYKHIGINRLSIGIQSWDQSILRHMGRQYDLNNLKNCIHLAQTIGLSNINFDHIISYPKQSDQILETDISLSLSLNPVHISIYPLERHPHTQIKRSPSSTNIIRQFAYVQKTLTTAGFNHYEELSFCKSNVVCRHNVDFWQGNDYMGIGASAVSKTGNIITTNAQDVGEYCNSLLKRNLPTRSTTLTKQQNITLKRDLRSRLMN